MNLYIAEKPSLARAIVAALPKPHKKQQSYIEVGNGDVVTWCIGHILEQAEPDAYDDAYKKWQLDHLPIFLLLDYPRYCCTCIDSIQQLFLDTNIHSTMATNPGLSSRHKMDY